MSSHFLDNDSIRNIKCYSSLKNIEIEVRFKITQDVYFHILKLLEGMKLKYKRSSFIDWLESLEEFRCSIRKRLFEDNTETWIKKVNKFFRKSFDYGFNLSISEEIEINPVYPLKPNVVRISERITFRLLSLTCELTKVIHKGNTQDEKVYFELELEAGRQSQDIIKDLENGIYICLKLTQQSFVNPITKGLDEWNAVYKIHEKERLVSKLTTLGINYRFLAKPRDINYSDFSGTKLLNPELGYRVTRKADGERKLLVFYQGVWLFWFSTPPQLITRDYDKVYEGIILDGELVELLDVKNLYIPFDAICNVNFDMSICQDHHQERLMLCQTISDYFKDLNLEYFSLMTKDFVNFESAEDFFSVIRKFFAGDPYLKYKTDGLLFVPANVSYTKQDIIKWKPQSKYTIDLRYRKGFWYSSDNQIFNIPIVIQSLNVMDGNVVELKYNPDQKVFTEVRIRFDKPFPNRSNVVRYVLKQIKNPITEETLKGENNMIFLKKFHNRLKRVIIDESLKRLKKQFTKVELLDVGSGRGADINKWHHIDRIYAVEPDKQRVEEFKTRLKTTGLMKKVSVFNERIENIKFDQPVNLVGLFNVLTLIDEQGLNELVRLLKRCVMYQGEILFLVFDGNIVDQVFIGSQSNHGAIFKELSFNNGEKIKYENGKIFIHIPDSLVENQTEFVFYPEKFSEMLLPEFTLIKYDHTANKEIFLSAKESVFNLFYAFGVFKRMDDDKEEIIKLKDGRSIRRTYCILDEELPELHPVLKVLSEEYRIIKSGHYNRYNYGIRFLKKYKDLHTIANNFNVQIELLDESGDVIDTINPYKVNKKITVMKNMLIEFINVQDRNYQDKA